MRHYLLTYSLIIYSVIHLECTALKMNILIYWSKSKSWIYFYIVLTRNLQVRKKFYWSWARGPVCIVRTVCTVKPCIKYVLNNIHLWPDFKNVQIIQIKYLEKSDIHTKCYLIYTSCPSSMIHTCVPCICAGSIQMYHIQT